MHGWAIKSNDRDNNDFNLKLGIERYTTATIFVI